MIAPMMHQGILAHNTRVIATQSINDIVAGDTGTIIAAWERPIVLVRWDKDGQPRRIHRNKLQLST